MNKLLFYPVNREVYLDGSELSPESSQKLLNHSPDGFSWGYGGSGPSQLALAILMRFVSNDEAIRRHQDFKWDVIAPITNSTKIVELELDIQHWLRVGKTHIVETLKEEDTTPRREAIDVSRRCGKGWADRCARSKGKKCTCQCGGQNHGKSKSR